MTTNFSQTANVGKVEAMNCPNLGKQKGGNGRHLYGRWSLILLVVNISCTVKATLTGNWFKNLDSGDSLFRIKIALV